MSNEKYGITDAHYLCDSAIFNTETGEILRLYQICDLLNEQDQKIKDLKHRLSNCIEPKFVVGQKIWFIDNGEIVCGEIEEFEYIISKYKQSYNFFINGYGWLLQKEVFATEEEARAKLEEMKK